MQKKEEMEKRVSADLAGAIAHCIIVEGGARTTPLVVRSIVRVHDFCIGLWADLDLINPSVTYKIEGIYYMYVLYRFCVSRMFDLRVHVRKMRVT